MYSSGTWGYVYALDAATGKELWRYDPKPVAFYARNPCSIWSYAIEASQ